MIILRGNETQTLVGRTALPAQQYAGEGAALATAGKQIGAVADQAVQFATALEDRQARVQATNLLKISTSAFENATNEYFYNWDKDHVQKGELPDVAVKAFEDELARIEKATYDTYSPQADANSYLKDGLPVILSEAKKDALTKARGYAHKTFLDIGRTQTKTIVESFMDSALLADATNDHAGYLAKSKAMVGYIEQQVTNGLYNRADADQLIAESYQHLEEKRGYQQIARNPEQFLSDFHTNKYPNLDPKLSKEFVTAAEQSLARKVETQERSRRLEKENAEFYRTTLKNELISDAMTDPSAALTRALRQENRLALGPEFDNTIATLRTLTNPDARHNDEKTLRTLNRSIERNPNADVYNDLDRALRNGHLKGDTYTSLTHRLTERIEKMKDKAEQDRLKRTNQSVDTYQKMLRVTGINDFDQTSNTAQQLFEDELRAKVEADPKADPLVEGKRLMIKYFDYIEDHATNVSETMLQKYKVKSPQDAVAKYERGEITRTESDILIWALQRQKTSPSSSTSSQPSTSNMVKKK